MLSVFMHKPLHEKILSLEEKGALIHKRPFPSYFKGQRFTGRVLAELKLRTRLENTDLDWQKVRKWQPETVLISSGETFDYTISNKSYIIKYCVKNVVPYYMISQFNWEHDMDISMEFRNSRKELSQNSSGHFFVSYRNYKNAEMQLAARIENARIISNPIKIDIEEAVPYPEGDVLKMAVVARYQPYIKGQDLLLQALADGFLKNVDFQISLYGSGDELMHLENLISFYNLAEKVIIKGSVADVKKIWEENQLLILSSRAEGTSLALLEAMYCGRTALVTNVGDSALWVGERGFVAESNAVESLVSTLKSAIAKKDYWKELGVSSRRFITKNHICDQDEQIVSCLVGKIGVSDVGYSPEEYKSLFSKELN